MYKYLIFFLLVMVSSCQVLQRLKTSIIPASSNFSSKEIEAVLQAGQRYLGVPYRNGGVDERGLDCSGLLFRMYADVNIVIPRPTYQQVSYGLYVPINRLEIGDWVFFRTNNATKVNHVGIITQIKNTNEVIFLHASTSKGVRYDNLFQKYWLNAHTTSIRPFKNILP